MSPVLAAVTARGVIPLAKTVDLDAHPVGQTSDGAIAVTLMGSLDNANMLAALLAAKGYALDEDPPAPETIVANLIHAGHKKGRMLFHAARDAAEALSGRYAFIATAAAEPECLVVVRHGAPLVVGIGGGEQAVAQIQTDLPDSMRRCIDLEDGDIAELRGNDIVIVDAAGQAVLRRLRPRQAPAQAA